MAAVVHGCASAAVVYSVVDNLMNMGNSTTSSIAWCACMCTDGVASLSLGTERQQVTFGAVAYCSLSVWIDKTSLLL